MSIDNFEKAKKCLNILSVSQRTINVHVGDDIDLRLEFLNATKRQYYRGASRIRETELKDDSENNPYYEYVFEYGVGLRFVIDDEAEEPEVAIEIEATFEAIYLSEEKLEREIINSFADQNVGYHVWPYWRELVQTNAAKMGIKTVIDIPHYLVK